MNFPTFLIVNLQNKLNIEKFVNLVEKNYKNYKIIIASTKLHKKYKNVYEYQFDDVEPDKVINTLMPKVEGERLVLVRQFDNDNLDEILNIEKAIKKNNQISLLKKCKNKFKSIIFNYINKIINLIFGYKLFDGYLSCVGFSSVPLSVLMQIENSSLYTKINKWQGIDLVYVNCNKCQKLKFKTKKIKHFVRIAISLLIMIGVILCWIFIPFLQSKLLLKMAMIFVILIAFMFVLLDCVILYVKRKIGENIFDKANIIDQN